MARIRQVRKRDMRIVPFDESKIAEAIYAAFRSVGEGDRTLAAELAQAVTHFLEEKHAGGLPGIEEIQDLVETVLIEMGQARAAKAYILYRQKRAMMRETLEVRKVEEGDGGDDGEEGLDGAGEGRGPALHDGSLPASGVARGVEPAGEVQSLPRVDQGSAGVSLWQKSKVARALIREADLDPAVAEEIAASVERKVLDSGIKRLSTALIRELVDNELFERGFSAKLEKQAPIGIPKYNLEQLIFGTDVKEGYTFPKTPPDIRNLIANRILEQYALEEVFTKSVADAHRDGRFFIHRLTDPIRLARLEWTLPERLGPQSPLGAGPFFRRLWQFGHFFSEEIRLRGLGGLIEESRAPGIPAAARAQGILERLSQLDSRPDIALEFDLTLAALPWLEGLRELLAVSPRRFLLSLRIGQGLFQQGDLSPLRELVADLFERGERLEFLPRTQAPPRSGLERSSLVGPGERQVAASEAMARMAPGMDFQGTLAANVGKITINLPQAAFRSARARSGSLESVLDETLDLAIKGHLERRRFVERLGTHRENPLWELLGKSAAALLHQGEDVEFGVGLLGLNECVKFLSGNDLHETEDARRLGLEIVQGIHRKLRRDERSLGLRLVLEETANLGPLRALERADRGRFPQMAEVDRGRQQPEWGPAYTDGVRLHRRAPVDPLRRVEELAQYLRYLNPTGGFVEDFPELRRSARDLLLSLLEESLPRVDGFVLTET